MKFGSVVSEERSFEIVAGWWTRREPARTEKLPGAFGLLELKKLLQVYSNLSLSIIFSKRGKFSGFFFAFLHYEMVSKWNLNSLKRNIFLLWDQILSFKF